MLLKNFTQIIIIAIWTYFIRVTKGCTKARVYEAHTCIKCECVYAYAYTFTEFVDVCVSQ